MVEKADCPDWIRAHITRPDPGPAVRIGIGVVFMIAFAAMAVWMGAFVQKTPPLLVGLLAGASAVSLALIVPSVVNWRRRARALAQGTSTRGKLRRVDVDSAAINHRHPRRLEWEFTVDEKAYVGTISTWRTDARPGQALTIYYLPADPTCNVALLADLPPANAGASKLPWWKRL